MVSMIALSAILVVETATGLLQRTAHRVILPTSYLKQSKFASSLLLALLAIGSTQIATAGLAIRSARFAMVLVSMNVPLVVLVTSRPTKDKAA